MANKSTGLPLTKKEKTVLALLIKAYSNREIAANLKINERTAKVHTYRILKKLKTKNRTKLLAIFFKDGADAYQKWLPQAQLTKREQDVFLLLVKGYSNEEIVAKLKITYTTVRTHIFRIFKKFKVKSRAKLMVNFFRKCGRTPKPIHAGTES